MTPHTYGHLIFENRTETNQHFQQMVPIQLLATMYKNVNRSILISLCKAQVQVDQGPPHKTRYTETNRKESGEEPQTQWQRGKFPDQTPMAQALRSAIDKWDIIKLKGFFKTKDTVNRTK